jgi:hypothetical protein
MGRKELDLAFPISVVTAETMQEQDRWTLPVYLAKKALVFKVNQHVALP